MHYHNDISLVTTRPAISQKKSGRIEGHVVVVILSCCLLGRHGSTSGSEEDLSPEHDQQSVKVRITMCVE